MCLSFIGKMFFWSTAPKVPEPDDDPRTAVRPPAPGRVPPGSGARFADRGPPCRALSLGGCHDRRRADINGMRDGPEAADLVIGSPPTCYRLLPSQSPNGPSRVLSSPFKAYCPGAVTRWGDAGIHLGQCALRALVEKPVSEICSPSPCRTSQLGAMNRDSQCCGPQQPRTVLPFCYRSSPTDSLLIGFP